MAIEGCIFCNSKIQKRTIFESELCFAVLDENPVSEGHTLIIPSRHVRSYFYLTKKEKDAIEDMLQSVKYRIDKVCHPDGYNIGINEGEAAGQTIEHTHIHLIPRYKGDVEDPIGGVRNVIPGKGDYVTGKI